MVGILKDAENKMTLDFKNEGDVIYLLGEIKNDIGCSEYLHKICGEEFSPAPYFNLDEEFRLHETVSKLIANRLISSAHDVSEGGLFVTLAESGFNRMLGFNINAENEGIRKDAFLFGEAQGRIIVTISADKVKDFESSLSIPFQKLGTVTSGDICVDDDDWGNINDWNKKYSNA